MVYTLNLMILLSVRIKSRLFLFGIITSTVIVSTSVELIICLWRSRLLWRSTRLCRLLCPGRSIVVCTAHNLSRAVYTSVEVALSRAVQTSVEVNLSVEIRLSPQAFCYMSVVLDSSAWASQACTSFSTTFAFYLENISKNSKFS